MTPEELDIWFVNEVLPLERSLMRFFRQHWRNASELEDLRQETYVRVYEAARKAMPQQVGGFVFTIARNLVIDRVRRAQIVAIESVADMESLEGAVDELTPERHAAGRAELRLLGLALDQLPPRCREVVALRKIEGISQREVASRLGIAEDTVEHQVCKGMRLLAQALLAQGVELTSRLVKKKDTWSAQ